MPRKHERVRVERGLYRAGKVYIAAVTPRGARRPRWRTLGEVGLMEARRLREEFAVELREGKVPAPGESRATFTAVADDWLAVQRQLRDVGELGARTYEAYESAVRLHVKPFFAGLPVRAIGPNHLIAWQEDQRLQGAATWSIKGRWSALRGVLALAVRRKLLDQHPADLLARRERPRSGEGRKRYLTDDEIRALLAATTARYRPLVALLLFGGLRISEALGLVWQDVDFDQGLLLVRHQLGRDGTRKKLKTDAGRRDVVMMAALAKLLREHKIRSPFSAPGDPLFATANRTSVSVRNATRAFGKAVRRAELEAVTQHSLRHTLASILIAQGRDPVFVADQLGHANPAVTLRTYAHLFRAAKQAQDTRDQLDADYGAILRGGA